ncbi:MAG: hypothetical protein RL708_491, partial [Bacteroidota bacterium]
MKKIFISFALLICIYSNCFAHKEWVHQYMVQEAYKMLQNQVGINTNIFEPTQFGINSSGANFYGDGNFQNDDPWITTQPIVTGAWWEDNQDIVWGYKTFLVYPTSGDASVCHFWMADNGDYQQTYLSAPPWSFNAYNAYDKAQKLLFPGTNNNKEIIINHSGSINVPVGIGQWTIKHNVSEWKITYNDIFDLYQDNFTIEEYQTTTGWHNITWTINNNIIGVSGKDLALQILGRVAHLLGDMSVPAHTHGVAHPCPVGYGDYYELDLGNSLV